MFNSTVLEVSLGIVFCFCAVSLIVSSINEAIASALQLRGKYLLQGIKALLNDPDFNGLALDVYNHALFNPHGTGDAANEQELVKKPPFVAPRQFALAFIDVLQRNASTPQDLASAIDSVPDEQLRQMLEALYQRVAGDVAHFELEIATWYDSAMQHVSAGYKRTIQFWTVLFGLVIAILMNIDALHLFSVLWIHPALVQGFDFDQLANAKSAWNQLNITELPIGWGTPPLNFKSGSIVWNYTYVQLLLMIVGWLITALSTLFGAPFWFDLLQSVTNLRGTARTNR
ncbi:hypothetical protein [Trinickia dinghuensis]|uniref:Uncharacterized protein n=1 Tax=Trinickia dinghuensis TaxID=2291023 RepID=A0A3D8JYV0_9BURK|nr:hypothetical protein [Trinickia dinghuensis]RDU97541.1 hypothetical protein DWV00_16785 [Trinickia dinghuensis]